MSRRQYNLKMWTKLGKQCYYGAYRKDATGHVNICVYGVGKGHAGKVRIYYHGGMQNQIELDINLLRDIYKMVEEMKKE